MKRGMDGQALTFVRCQPAQFEAVMAMYERAVAELERTVNYPKWSEEHPSRDYVKEAIEKGEQFACVSGGAVLGAVVLNEELKSGADYARYLCSGKPVGLSCPAGRLDGVVPVMPYTPYEAGTADGTDENFSLEQIIL